MAAALLLFLGVGLFGVGFYMRSRVAAGADARGAWPTAGGTVVSSRMTVQIAKGESGTSAINMFEVRYRYAAGGGERQGIATFLEDKQLAERRARYGEGASVAVHYDPQSPDNSALEPGLKPFSPIVVLCWIFGSILLILGAIALIP